MTRRNPALLATFQNRMRRDQDAVLEDLNLGGELVNIDDAAARDVRDAVKIAVDADHAVPTEAALQLENRSEWRQRQGPETGTFFGERFPDDALGRGMHPAVGNGIEPMRQLPVQIVEIAKRAGQEEVFPDIPERPLHLALRLRPIGSAGFGVVEVVASQIDERSVVDDAAAFGLADHRGLHPVVEDLARRAAQRLERGDMAAKDGG